MIKIKLLLIIAFVFSPLETCGGKADPQKIKDAAMIEFLHDYTKTFTTTITRAVGATTRSERGTLPQPAPDDANSIWVVPSPTGNDANPGTQASPVATINQADSLLGGAKLNIQIFRKTHVGPLDFTLTGNITFAVNETIQVELGEIANIEVGAFTFGGAFSSTNKMNGINWTAATKTSGNTLNNFGSIENCSFDQAITDDNIIFNGLNVQYNVFKGAKVLSYNDATTWTTISNNIFIGRTPTSSTQKKLAYAEVGFPVSTSQTWTLSNNIFIDFDRLLQTKIDETVPGNQDTYKIQDSIIIDCNYIQWAIGGTGSTLYNTLEIVNSLLLINVDAVRTGQTLAVETLNPDISITEINTDLINTDLNPLFHDFLTGLEDSDAEGFRLQENGKLLAGSTTDRYFIDSPLKDAGVSSGDVAPWTEDTALTSDAFSQKTKMPFPAASYTETEEKKGAQTIEDRNGNIHSKYDSKRRVFTFNFGTSVHISNVEMRELRNMLGETGVKKMFPKGENANLFQEAVSSGVFSSTDNSVTITIVGEPMVRDNWRGYWMSIAGDDFYINLNDTTKLYLSDKLANGFPSDGPVSFIISYILVNNKPDPYIIQQQNFTEFKKGGAIREINETAQPYDYTINGFTVLEVEDLEENI
jgi:hypothetical protein